LGRTEFCGFPLTPTYNRSLYLYSEEGSYFVTQFLEMNLSGLDYDPAKLENMRCADTESFEDEKSLFDFLKNLLAIENFDIIVIDSYSDYLSKLGAELNNNDHARTVKHKSKFLKQNGCVVLLNHHASDKNKEVGTFLGATGFKQICRTIIEIVEDNNQRILSCAKNQYGRKFEPIVCNLTEHFLFEPTGDIMTKDELQTLAAGFSAMPPRRVGKPKLAPTDPETVKLIFGDSPTMKTVGIKRELIKHFSVSDRTQDFWINDVLVHVSELGVAGSNKISSCNLPANFRNYNAGVTASAQVMKIANVNITFADNNYTKAFPHQMSGSGASSYQTQTGAAAHGQTCVWTNGANPAAAAPTATTAALGSGLGGIFIANINGLAVTTDFIIQSYQVPLGTALIPGKSLYITGIKVSGVNTVAANGAGLTTWAMALAYGHTNVSLATAEGVISKAPRRIPLGVQSLGNAAPIGTVVAPDLLYSFVTPVCVQPGEFVQTILRFIINTSVATQAINFYVTFEGYFE